MTYSVFQKYAWRLSVNYSDGDEGMSEDQDVKVLSNQLLTKLDGFLSSSLRFCKDNRRLGELVCHGDFNQGKCRRTRVSRFA
jgi:hypothetical protein